MKTIIQRVSSADVTVDGDVVGRIDSGFMILFGAGQGDTEEEADYIARKTARMRIFSDENGKMNLSLKDIGGGALVISQFTLYADCRHGNRPGFTGAESPDRAEQLYDYFCERLGEEAGIVVEKGIFGADMKVSLVNDGPVTILLEKEHEVDK